MEWRNVGSSAPGARHVRDHLRRERPITFAYTGIDALALEQGGAATVGIENAAGTVALQYSLNQPELRSPAPA